MKLISKRAGFGALAMTIFAASFGTAMTGAVAQDAEPDALELVQAEQNNAQAPTDAAQEPQVRFVLNEVVQDIPEQPEEPETQNIDAASLRELVGDVDTSGQMSREMMCLAQAVYFESRGEPLDGQLAVARVVINRAESNVFPDDYCSVVTQRAQFSFVRRGRIPEPNRGSSAWTRAKAIARIAHRDLWESPADDALYFHARHVRPRWAGRMTARATIDNHIFYR
jgi:spore germination cell wall hydrolase CwlJ-like protein